MRTRVWQQPGRGAPQGFRTASSRTSLTRPLAPPVLNTTGAKKVAYVGHSQVRAGRHATLVFACMHVRLGLPPAPRPPSFICPLTSLHPRPHARKTLAPPRPIPPTPPCPHAPSPPHPHALHRAAQSRLRCSRRGPTTTPSSQWVRGRAGGGGCVCGGGRPCWGASAWNLWMHVACDPTHTPPPARTPHARGSQPHGARRVHRCAAAAWPCRKAHSACAACGRADRGLRNAAVRREQALVRVTAASKAAGTRREMALGCRVQPLRSWRYASCKAFSEPLTWRAPRKTAPPESRLHADEIAAPVLRLGPEASLDQVGARRPQCWGTWSRRGAAQGVWGRGCQLLQQCRSA